MEYIKTLDDEEKFDLFEEDGSFIMCYSDWRNIFNNMFICIDFEDEWDGVRFFSEWTEETSGGTPSPMTVENREKWARNP